MLRPRSAWLRVLRLYGLDHEIPSTGALLDDALFDTAVHARSRYRNAADPSRFALYSVHDADVGPLLPFGMPFGGRPGGRRDEHTLVAVREFRRVPLDASSLALTVFTARPGRAVPVVAALVDFVERAVDLYQPAYLLLAHSLEEPRTSLLLTAVQDSLALGSAATAAFRLDALLSEVEPLLAAPPECYEYCPDVAPAPLVGAVSPYAV